MTREQEVLILCGLPASGKTRLAEEWVREAPDTRHRINYDDLRLEMFGPRWKFNRAQENEMQARSFVEAKLHLAKGHSVVVDNTNLTDRARQRWVNIAREFGIVAEVHEVNAHINACIERDRKREKRVGRAVIERMALFHGFIDWKDGSYPYRYADGKDFVICDIDGTLANGEHRQHYLRQEFHKPDCSVVQTKATALYRDSKGNCTNCDGKARSDWDAFHEHVDKDTVIEPIKQLLETLYRANYHILLVSGRWLDKGCGIKTEDWLDRHNIPYRHLFMRNGGDSREDSIIKREILDLLPKERIAWVLDDRDRVVKMWREQGLTCLQCAEGAF